MPKTKRTVASPPVVFGPEGLVTTREASSLLSFPVPSHTQYRVSGARWVGTRYCIVRRDVLAPEALLRPAFLALPERRESIDAQVQQLVQETLGTTPVLRWARQDVPLPFVMYVTPDGQELGADDFSETKSLVRSDVLLAAYLAPGAPHALFVDAACGASVLYAAGVAPNAFANHPDPNQATMFVARFSPWGLMPDVALRIASGQTRLAQALALIDALVEGTVAPSDRDVELFGMLKETDIGGLPHHKLLLEALLLPGWTPSEAVRYRNRLLRAVRGPHLPTAAPRASAP